MEQWPLDSELPWGLEGGVLQPSLDLQTVGWAVCVSPMTSSPRISLGGFALSIAQTTSSRISTSGYNRLRHAMQLGQTTAADSGPATETEQNPREPSHTN
ncbi:hypothetical protein CKO42_22380 [Lamprobacter modestohalophilus]|uniref:Uncharacterized protein n=1 Tax=Lamprobacter modestohalophilus TaxID=1064514 RepID=A0A9X0WCM2_9GAMM|nr:hypothetical protein [Lamprobacter modestohalophilus]